MLGRLSGGHKWKGTAMADEVNEMTPLAGLRLGARRGRQRGEGLFFDLGSGALKNVTGASPGPSTEVGALMSGEDAS
jgi:hypothetical protein